MIHDVISKLHYQKLEQYCEASKQCMISYYVCDVCTVHIIHTYTVIYCMYIYCNYIHTFLHGIHTVHIMR
jgi:hypothetical protein